MPLSKSLSKVSKSVGKSKAAIHVKGRNFKRLNRATLRQQKLHHKKSLHLEQKLNELHIVKYIQDEILQVPEKEMFGLKEMKAYIENFLGRFHLELAQLKADRKKGRPPCNRQLLLEEKIKHDEKVYITGIKIPDISNKDVVKSLRKWNGTIGGTTVLRYTFISRDMQELPIVEVDMS